MPPDIPDDFNTDPHAEDVVKTTSSPMKILVTGANGFIGSHVVRQLSERGDLVRCLLRSTSDTSRIDDLIWQRVIGDVRDTYSIIDAAKGCDAIIHLASPSSWDDINKEEIEEIIVEGTEAVLRAAKENGNIRVVYCSSVIAIRGTSHPVIIDEESEFNLADTNLRHALAKYRGERLVTNAFERNHQNVVIVNPGEIYGPNDYDLVTAGNLIDIANSWPVWVARGGTSIAYIDDTVAAIIAALDRGIAGQRYIISGQNVTIRELVEMTLDILGRKVPIVQIPIPLARTAGWLGKRLKVPLPFNPAVVPYATRFWMTDNSKAKEQLKVHFRSARETLKPTIDWLIETGQISPPKHFPKSYSSEATSESVDS